MVKFKNNIPEFKKKFVENAKSAVEEMAAEAHASVQYMMLHGYSDPHPNRNGPGFHTEIYDTGALFKDLRAEVEDNHFRIGNTLDYATYVHEGTWKLQGRPYITDGVMHVADLEGVAAEELKKGME